MKTVSGFLLASLALAICSPITAYAQIEVHGDVAATFDLPGSKAAVGLTNLNSAPATFNTAQSATRQAEPSFGGGFSATFFKHYGFYADYADLVPSATQRATVTLTGSTATGTETDTRKFQIFQAGFQFTPGTQYRIVPYFQVGGGFLHFSDTVTDIFTNVTNPGSGAPVTTTTNDPLLQYGGGIRYHIKEFQPSGRVIGILVGVDGYYLQHPLFEPLAGLRNSTVVGGVTFGNQAFKPHNGFGRASFGFFYEFHH